TADPAGGTRRRTYRGSGSRRRTPKVPDRRGWTRSRTSTGRNRWRGPATRVRARWRRRSWDGRVRRSGRRWFRARCGTPGRAWSPPGRKARGSMRLEPRTVRSGAHAHELASQAVLAAPRDLALTVGATQIVRELIGQRSER